MSFLSKGFISGYTNVLACQGGWHGSVSVNMLGLYLQPLASLMYDGLLFTCCLWGHTQRQPGMQTLYLTAAHQLLKAMGGPQCTPCFCGLLLHVHWRDGHTREHHHSRCADYLTYVTVCNCLSTTCVVVGLVVKTRHMVGVHVWWAEDQVRVWQQTNSPGGQVRGGRQTCGLEWWERHIRQSEVRVTCHRYKTSRQTG